MTDPIGVTPQQPHRPMPVPAWALVGGLLVAAVVVLSAAMLGWGGVLVIVIVLAGMCGLLVRWSRWPRPAREES